MASQQDTQRAIKYTTRGAGHGGPITRLMSPSDLGQILKPFVFLDIFSADKSAMQAMGDMPMHPHSGIATVTVFTEGHMRYQHPSGHSGKLEFGGTEWMRAGGGVWHGKEMSPGNVERLQGFQLWLALPPELENSPAEGQFFEAEAMQRAGPACVIVGEHGGVKSPVPAPTGINYLLVKLKPGEFWVYTPAKGHSIAWLAMAKGSLMASKHISAGEMAVFESGETSISLKAADDSEAVFVLGSARPHPHTLHLGNYSVHTSAQALIDGEKKIVELGENMRRAGNRQTATGTIPVYR